MPEVIETTARDAEPDEPGSAVEPAHDRRDLAVAEAAEAAIAMPGVPGRDEFLSLAMQARMLSLSGAAPAAVRNSPYVAFHVAMVGRDLGISPSAALELIDVIDSGRGPQLSLSPQLMNGQIRRLGLGEIVKGESTALSCTAIAVGPGGRDRRCRLRWPEHVADCECDILGVGTFTWEDARMAGLVAEGCEPGKHTPKCQNRQSPGWARCNQGYVTYPQRMLWWRASGYLADDVFPEAGLGLYSPEELDAVVDEHGRPIDVASVELPPGYEPAAVGSGRPADDPADADELWAFQARLHALPPAQQQAWREQKVQQERLRGTPSHSLSASQLRLARSMVSGLESAARKADADYDPEQAATMVQVQAFLGVCAVAGWRLGPNGGTPVPEPEPSPDPTSGAGEAEHAVSTAAPAPETAAGSSAPSEEPAGPETDEETAHLRDLVASAEASRETAREAAAEITEIAARPTVADVAEARKNIEATVKGMSIEQVRTDLADFGLPTTGGAVALRRLLVGHLVALETNPQENSQ